MIKHETIEKNIGLMAFFMVIAVSIGGLTQIVPLFFQDVTNTPVEGMKPRSALEPENAEAALMRGAQHVLNLLAPYLEAGQRAHLMQLTGAYREPG